MKNLIVAILIGVILLGGFFILVKIYRRKTMSTAYLYNNSANQTANSYSTNITNTSTQTDNQVETSGGINLDITAPSDNQTVSSANLTVTGTTTPNAEVSVNEANITADANGKFSVTVNLDEGDNVISIVANDSKGNFIEKDLNITYTP